MRENEYPNASHHVSSMYGLVKLFGVLHFGIIGLQVSVALQNWKLAILFSAAPLLSVLNAEVRFLWLQAEWFRVSLMLQLVVQAIAGAAATFEGTTRFAAIGGGLGLFLFMVHLSVINNFCKKYGIPRRDSEATDELR